MTVSQAGVIGRRPGNESGHFHVTTSEDSSRVCNQADMSIHSQISRTAQWMRRLRRPWVSDSLTGRQLVARWRPVEVGRCGEMTPVATGGVGPVGI